MTVVKLMQTFGDYHLHHKESMRNSENLKYMDFSMFSCKQVCVIEDDIQIFSYT